jgi:hypothetical protein
MTKIISARESPKFARRMSSLIHARNFYRAGFSKLKNYAWLNCSGYPPEGRRYSEEKLERQKGGPIFGPP